MDTSYDRATDSLIARSYRVATRSFDHCDQVADMTQREGSAEFTQLSAVSAKHAAKTSSRLSPGSS